MSSLAVSFGNLVSSSLSSLKIDTLGNMARKTAVVAVPMIGLYAVSNIPSAESSVLACIACATCLAAANPGCFWPCAICFATLPIPTGICPNQG